MEENYSLIWSFRNRFDDLKRSIITADETCPKSIEFHLVDAASNEDVIQNLRLLCSSIQDRKIRICESSYRTTLTEAWNIGMMTTDCRYAIFVSSDVFFAKDTNWFGAISECAQSGYEYILTGSHAVFLIDKKALPKMGWFDENFVLGPHADVDYMIRASENGVKIIDIGENGWFLHEGLPGSYLERMKNSPDGYLPMNNFTNDYVFKDKWETDWPGWEWAFKKNIDPPHPPTCIGSVTRKINEIDPHPLFTNKYR